MKRLKMLGYWKGNHPVDSIWPLPHAFSRPLSVLPDAAKIAEYLETAQPLNEDLGYSFCRFHCGISDREMGCFERSDGVWIWPAGYAHYFTAHSILLPKEFIEHIRSNNYRPDGKASGGPPSSIHELQFWVDYCFTITGVRPDHELLMRIENEFLDGSTSDSH